MKIKSRKNGILLIILGIVMQFINIITYGLWEIDIDIFGLFIVIIGIILMMVWWKK